jgi:hypothetical protein
MTRQDLETKLLDLSLEPALVNRIIGQVVIDSDEARDDLWKMINNIRRLEGLRVMENVKELCPASGVVQKMTQYQKEWREHFPKQE